MYPAVADKMSVVWPHLYKKVLEKVRTVRIKDKHLMQMLLVVREDFDNPKS